MNIEQEARDLLNAVSQERAGYDTAAAHDNREESFSLEAICRALEARNEAQAAFDAFRREVSEHNAVLRDALRHTADANLNWRADHIRFIIPEPVDPLIEVLAKAMQPNVLSSGKMYAERLRAALAKIGGKVVFEGEGA